ncbi:MAG: hypothetical protein QOI32_772 [Thermoleophilaceae bacterium]|jgi:hypothetical protein|nr:hypothetical protein [Thermoleophilaceae bacterium]
MNAAVSLLAAQMHRNPRVLATEQPEVRYETGRRPLRPSRSRRRRRL